MKTVPQIGDPILTTSGTGIVMGFNPDDKKITYVKNYAGRRNPSEAPLDLFSPLSNRAHKEFVTWVLKGKQIKFSIWCISVHGPINLGETMAVSPSQAASNVLYQVGGKFTNEPKLRVTRAKEYVVGITGSSEYDKSLLAVRIIGYT